MSDPVSNAEIEDVLSSIRRLISESKASDGREVSGKTDKLVLTPAFRVHDDAGAKTASPVPEGDRKREDPVAPVISETAPQSAPAEPVATPEDDGSVPVFSHRGYAPSSVEDAEELRSDTSTSSDDARAPSGRASGFDDVMDSNQDGWEPDGGDETAQSDVLMFHAARLRSADDDEIVGESMAGEWSDDAENDEADEAPFIAVNDPADADPKPPAELVRHQPERKPAELPSREVEIVGDDTDIIDEEVVQAMVARLLREELQGEVGEKITQSIRRFVRREIERALTLKGLE